MTIEDDERRGSGNVPPGDVSRESDKEKSAAQFSCLLCRSISLLYRARAKTDNFWGRAMPEILRFPSLITANFTNAKINGSNISYMSFFPPPQIVNCILMPAQRHVVMSIRMLIASRIGTTSNNCQFQFRIFNAATGATITALPTTPGVLNAMAMPVMTWMSIHSTTPGQVVNPGEYLGVVFTGTSGTKVVGSNDLEILPAIEVLIH